MAAADLKLNKTYTFNIKANAGAVLGQTHTNLKLKGIIDSTEAIRYGDIETIHANIKAVGNIANLPEFTVSCTWLLFNNADGEKVIIAQEYIDSDTIQEITKLNARFELRDITTEDLEIIRGTLSDLGYRNVDVTMYDQAN